MILNVNTNLLYNYYRLRLVTCQRSNKKLKKANGPLNPVPIRSKLWYQVGIDLIGPLTQTAKGNKYIITLTDYFSKWAEADAVVDKSAGNVAKCVYNVRFDQGFVVW